MNDQLIADNTDEAILPFRPSRPNTMGIEIELQLLNRRNYTLSSDALDLVRMLKKEDAEQIKLELTQGMIEINSSVHTDAGSLTAELCQLRTALVSCAKFLNIDICGGGAHPFQHWNEQRITPSERFHYLDEKYGYLAKTFTVFGQHIHVGVGSGDDALYVTHALSRFIPHFIALSAASPFYLDTDTRFYSSRSNVVRAFPLAGTSPPFTTWSAFEQYYQELKQLGVVLSIKDFYWDIRPKPEFGTVEIRVCDTPLTIEHAARLGCYAQILTRWILDRRPFEIDPDFYLLYQFNRFEASRYGLAGKMLLRQQDQGQTTAPPHSSIGDHLLHQLTLLQPYVLNSTEAAALQALGSMWTKRVSDADWLRNSYAHNRSLPDMMRSASRLWMNDQPPDYFQ